MKSKPAKPAAAATAQPELAAKPKRGRGRPRLADGAAVAGKYIGLRVTAAEADALNAYAAEQCTTVAELLRPALAELLARAGERANAKD